MEEVLVLAGGAVTALGASALTDAFHVDEGEPGRGLGLVYAALFTFAGLALLAYGLVAG